MRKRLAAGIGIAALIVAGGIVLGTACHEIMGHALVARICGAEVSQIVVLGVQVWPGLEWLGSQGKFGWCRFSTDIEDRCYALALLAGSGSTWVVAVLSAILLRVRSWRPGWHTVLFSLSLWWADLFLHTLPSFGCRRFVFWGSSLRAEPVEAVAQLGIPIPFFQAFVLVGTGTLAVMSIVTAIRLTRGFLRPAGITVGDVPHD
jgi:hypothetical protein